MNSTSSLLWKAMVYFILNYSMWMCADVCDLLPADWLISVFSHLCNGDVNFTQMCLFPAAGSHSSIFNHNPLQLKGQFTKKILNLSLITFTLWLSLIRNTKEIFWRLHGCFFLFGFILMQLIYCKYYLPLKSLGSVRWLIFY